MLKPDPYSDVSELCRWTEMNPAHYRRFESLLTFDITEQAEIQMSSVDDRNQAFADPNGIFNEFPTSDNSPRRLYSCYRLIAAYTTSIDRTCECTRPGYCRTYRSAAIVRRWWMWGHNNSFDAWACAQHTRRASTAGRYGGTIYGAVFVQDASGRLRPPTLYRSTVSLRRSGSCASDLIDIYNTGSGRINAVLSRYGGACRPFGSRNPGW